MAEVWKAFDPQLKRFVAIKYLHANMQADPTFLHALQVKHRPGDSPDQRDAPITQIALIDTPNQTPPDFLNHVIFHLNSIAQFPGAPSDLRQHTAVILNSTGMLHTWLEAVKKDAITLLNDQQLNQANTLYTFNDLADNAEFAYSGQVDPITLQVQHNGVVQIYDEIQRLATFQLNKAAWVLIQPHS